MKMLTRTSSDPVIGTILSPSSECPIAEFESLNNNKHSTILNDQNAPNPNLNLTSFQRPQSDGNLEGLVHSSCGMEEFRNSVTQTKSSFQHNDTMLETAPSFSIFNSASEFRDEMIQRKDSNQEPLERTITIGDDIEGLRGEGFSFEEKGMGLIVEKGEEEEEDFDANVQPASPPMYLAAGLGVGDSGFGSHAWEDDLSMENVDEGGNPEVYYKKMVDEYPCHPFFLKNYAQALQSKGDLNGAEDYYLRTTLANPADGEALVEYAKLVWQLHNDQDKALSYFECAAQANPQDSSVLGAYASFLWEIEDDQEEQETRQHQIQVANGDSMPDRAPGSRRSNDPEENCKMLIEENPNNALFLRNYAQFLCQSKGGLRGAEEYYLRAIQADPADGEIMAEYAKLVWELHHDSSKALSYFERAAQANPKDSSVLAAYAYFLWESGEDEDETVTQGWPVVQGGAVSAANG